MKNKKRIATIIRWIARIWGSLLFVFVLIMIGGELVEHLSGNPMFFIDSVSDIIGILFFPIFCIGVGIAFKWEGLGGLIIIGATIGTHVADGRLTLDLLSGIFLTSGLLFLIYWFLSRVQREINETH